MVTLCCAICGRRPAKPSLTATSMVSVEPPTTSGAMATVKIDVAFFVFGVYVWVLMDVPFSFASNVTVLIARSSLVTTVATTSRPAYNEGAGDNVKLEIAGAVLSMMLYVRAGVTCVRPARSVIAICSVAGPSGVVGGTVSTTFVLGVVDGYSANRSTRGVLSGDQVNCTASTPAVAVAV